MPIIARAPRPASTPVYQATEDPLVVAYGRDVGPRTAELLSTWQKNLGVHAISKRNLSERLFNFCEGTALGVRIEEKAYDIDDAYVTDSPIRRAVCESLKEHNSQSHVAYIESSGLVELGAGFLITGTIVANPYVAVGWSMGVTGSVLARVRQSFPVALSERESVSTHFKYKNLDFPFRAQSALHMNPGAEIEITGQGHVLVNGGVGMVAGIVSRPASVGFGLTAGGASSVKKELNLNILALDKPGHVRVCIRRLNEEASTFMAKMRAGLIFSTGALTGTLIGGMLRFYSEKLSAPSFEEFLNLFTTLNASIYGGVTHKHNLIGAWELDLNDPRARAIYESLVLLDTNSADEAIMAHQTFIREIKASENELEFRIGADIGLLGQKIFASENIVTHREGSVSSTSSPRFKYENSIFTYRKKSIVRGVREVNWEAVSIKLADQKTREPHLHVLVDEQDWDFAGQRITKLVRFGECLGVEKAEMLGTDASHLANATQQLRKSQDVKIKCDVYFTKKGIASFDRASFEMAKNAFLVACQKIFPEIYGPGLRGLGPRGMDLTSGDPRTLKAKQIIARYLELHQPSLANAWNVLHHHHLYDDYRELTGRDLKKDSALMAEANQFAQIVTAAQKRESADELARFFRELSKTHRIHFMPTVAALGILAGAEETLVHELSISSPSLTISNIPEEAIAHPRDAVARALHALASSN